LLFGHKTNKKHTTTQKSKPNKQNKTKKPTKKQKNKRPQKKKEEKKEAAKHKSTKIRPNMAWIRLDSFRMSFSNSSVTIP